MLPSEMVSFCRTTWEATEFTGLAFSITLSKASLMGSGREDSLTSLSRACPGGTSREVRGVFWASAASAAAWGPGEARTMPAACTARNSDWKASPETSLALPLQTVQVNWPLPSHLPQACLPVVPHWAQSTFPPSQRVQGNFPEPWQASQAPKVLLVRPLAESFPWPSHFRQDVLPMPLQ